MSYGRLGSARRTTACIAILIALAVIAGCSSGSGSTTATTRATAHPGSATTTTRERDPAPATQNHVPLFAHYYLWWDAQHWRAKLGSAYPTNLPSPPVPAELDGAGCAATSSFPGDTLLDVPAPPLGLYSQDNPVTLKTHVDQASGAGIDGFVVSWSGTGDPSQHASSSPFNRRLDLLVRAVHAHNARTGEHFSLMLGYQGLDNRRVVRPLAHIANDLDYFTRTYTSDPAFHVPAYGSKPVVMLLDSRKFTVPDLQGLLTGRRASLTLIGDEHGQAEWRRGVAPLFDGDGWYWSAQNPTTNPSGPTKLHQLSEQLHAEHKLWFSPLSAGYNKSNFGIGGTCVPRSAGATLRLIYALNEQSSPDGWMLISWNEFFENTYVEPSVRYGTSLIQAIRALGA